MPAFAHDCGQLQKPKPLEGHSRDFSPQYIWNSNAYGLPDAMLRLIPRKTRSNDADRYRVSTVSLWTCLYLSGCISSGCAFFPEQITDDPKPSRCLLSTPEWKLTFQEIDNVTACQGSGKDAAYCLLTVGLVIPAGSFVVAGSIVIVGNTMHWLEYQGKCEDSFLRQQLALFKNSIRH